MWKSPRLYVTTGLTRASIAEIGQRRGSGCLSQPWPAAYNRKIPQPPGSVLWGLVPAWQTFALRWAG